LGRGLKPGKVRRQLKAGFVADPETAKNLEKILKGKILKKVKRAARRTLPGKIVIGIEVFEQILKKQRKAQGPQEAVLGEILVAIDELLSDLEPFLRGGGTKQQIELPTKAFEPKTKPPPLEPKIIPPRRRRKAKPGPRRKIEPFPEPPPTPEPTPTPRPVPVPTPVPEPPPVQTQPKPSEPTPTKPPPAVAQPTEPAPSDTRIFRRPPTPQQPDSDQASTEKAADTPSLAELEQVALPTGLETQRQTQTAAGTGRAGTGQTGTQTKTGLATALFLPFGFGRPTAPASPSRLRDLERARDRERERGRDRLLDTIRTDQRISTQRDTKTRQRECQEVKTRRRRKGKCREGFFREVPGKTRFITWREVDCLTGKETSLSKLRRKVGV
jgi:hypothetical protein